MPTTAVYSWTIPERGVFDWGAQVARLFTQIDATVAQVRDRVTSRATLTISAGVPYSGTPIPASAMVLGGWTVLSVAPIGAVEGTFSVQRSGSFTHARVTYLSHDGGTFQTSGTFMGYLFRFVASPGSAILGGHSSLFVGPGRRVTTLIGDCISSLGVGHYGLQAQVQYVGSFSPAVTPQLPLVASPPLTVVITQVWSN